jgi:hypothetical protein
MRKAMSQLDRIKYRQRTRENMGVAYFAPITSAADIDWLLTRLAAIERLIQAWRMAANITPVRETTVELYADQLEKALRGES